MLRSSDSSDFPPSGMYSSRPICRGAQECTGRQCCISCLLERAGLKGLGREPAAGMQPHHISFAIWLSIAFTQTFVYLMPPQQPEELVRRLGNNIQERSCKLSDCYLAAFQVSVAEPKLIEAHRCI